MSFPTEEDRGHLLPCVVGYNFVGVIFLPPRIALEDCMGQGPFTGLTEGVLSH